MIAATVLSRPRKLNGQDVGDWKDLDVTFYKVKRHSKVVDLLSEIVLSMTILWEVRGTLQSSSRRLVIGGQEHLQKVPLPQTGLE
jgi:hypothetical protein